MDRGASDFIRTCSGGQTVKCAVAREEDLFGILSWSTNVRGSEEA